jgi:hypothetical protein
MAQTNDFALGIGLLTRVGKGVHKMMMHKTCIPPRLGRPTSSVWCQCVIVKRFDNSHVQDATPPFVVANYPRRVTRNTWYHKGDPSFDRRCESGCQDLRGFVAALPERMIQRGIVRPVLSSTMHCYEARIEKPGG